MKKFFTLITLTSALIPAIHGMDASLPADVQKKYDNLITHIQNADIEAFKPEFDAITLPAENIVILQYTVLATKEAVAKKLNAMGDNNKSWSKIAKGGLATIGGAIAGISGAAGLIYSLNNLTIDNETINDFLVDNLATIGNLSCIPSSLFDVYITELSNTAFQGTVATTSLLYLGAAYKGFTYAHKTFKAGLNYKEHLQNMLNDLDAIDAHIAQAKA